MSKEMCTPFSNGTEAMDWMDQNCDRCVKAYKPLKEGEWPSFKTMQTYCSIGKECKLKLHIDIGFITSEVPVDICKQIGMDEVGRLKNCMHFSDNEDDGFKPNPRPKPDNTPDNQMVMPFIIENCLNKKELV